MISKDIMFMYVNDIKGFCNLLKFNLILIVKLANEEQYTGWIVILSNELIYDAREVIMEQKQTGTRG